MSPKIANRIVLRIMRRNGITVYGFVSGVCELRPVASVANLEAFHAALRRNILDDKSGNVAAQLAISNCFEKSVDLSGVALNFELNPTVDKVLNPPDHFETGGQVPDDIPETDPLDASFVENTFGNHNPLRQGFDANRQILF